MPVEKGLTTFTELDTIISLETLLNMIEYLEIQSGIQEELAGS